MRTLLLLPFLLAVAAPAAAQDAEREDPVCYDVAVQGTLRAVTFQETDEIGWITTRRLVIDVSKTYDTPQAPDRIEVALSSHSEPNPARFKEALFFLSKGENGYGLVSFAIDTPLDGRGLLSRGLIQSLARKQGLERCKA